MSENEAQTCQKCGAPAKEGDVFCRACGIKHLSEVSGIKPPAEIKRVCLNCGNALRPAARFCDLCGEECVKMRRERRGGKHKRGGCFLILAAVLLCFAAGISAVAIYDVSRNMSLKGVLTFLRENLFASDSADEEAEEEPDGGSAAAVSEDLYGIVVPNDSLTAVAPIAEDERDMSSPDVQPGREEGTNPPENTYEGEGSRPGDSGERDERADGVENTLSDAGSGAMVLASPLNVSAESSPLNISPESEDQTASAGSERRVPGAWTERDSDGYSTVATGDEFFTSSQAPELLGVVTGRRVNVRSAPNTDSRIKRQLDSGAEVELVRRFSSGKEPYYWFEVRSFGESGWIYGQFIRPESGGSEVPAVSPADTGEPDGDSADATVINTSP
ncbi:MAG: SH3 domain-containing protein [Synergistaceae bacterium]|jgi:hypothetical protein|nr:SH3 domain-containing protein [Synergistaceae bacterium]